MSLVSQISKILVLTLKIIPAKNLGDRMENKKFSRSDIMAKYREITNIGELPYDFQAENQKVTPR
jgi:hypothetical protein